MAEKMELESTSVLRTIKSREYLRRPLVRVRQIRQTSVARIDRTQLAVQAYREWRLRLWRSMTGISIPPSLSDLPTWKRVLFYAALGLSVLIAGVGADTRSDGLWNCARSPCTGQGANISR